MIKKEQDLINAVPSKRLYRSIIADYGLNTAIAELIDNVIDSRRRRKFQREVVIDLYIDLEDQTIFLSDDAGGIKEVDLAKLVTPGASHNDGENSTIGIFGVGSKRAAVALAREIRISTRFANEPKTYQIEYNDEWLATEDWHIPYYEVESIKQNTTSILLTRLRFALSASDVTNLRDHISKTYAHFIDRKEVKIILNTDPVKPSFFNQWSYPPEAEPHTFEKKFYPPNHTLPIIFRITSGLTYESGSIGGNYGVYIYCNDRLIESASKAAEFGFTSGVAGVPHPRMSNARIIVELVGGASQLPWNSSKTSLNFNHEVFRAIRDDLHVVVKNATALSKRLQGDFENSIAPFREGSVDKTVLSKDEHLKPSKLPPIPKTKESAITSIRDANRDIGNARPWTTGAYESIIAVEAIKKIRTLTQKNRIILVILDSTMEIACKDYLAHEAPSPMSEAALIQLFKNRIDVHKKVQETILPGDNLWKSMDYFYKARCELVHKRFSVTISDDDVANFQNSLEKVLSAMYSLKFPKD
jgi:hypothetical protein